MTVQDLLEKLRINHDLSKQELVLILKNMEESDRKVLYDLALKTKTDNYGLKVFFRGLIEFSNICRQDCLYCGLRRSNKEISRYRLTPAEIVQCCQNGYGLGYRTFVLQSGEDSWYTAEILTDLIKRIKHEFPDAAITLSIGERDASEYKSFFEAGADRFLLRHETASRRLYEALHPTMQFENRQKCLHVLKEIGYQVGAGFMVGLPGQTLEDLAEDLCFLKQLDPDMAGIGPFIPHCETPLRDERGGTVEATLVLIALTRLLLPDCLLPATTAMGSLHPQGREMALQCGANVVMPILTPNPVRRHYKLYDNKICLEDEPGRCRFCIENRIRSVGFEPDLGRGDRLSFLTKIS
jgi:biotin synthase